MKCLRKKIGAYLPNGTKRRNLKKVQNDPVLKEMWLQLRQTWFPGYAPLDDYNVAWSRRRQKRTLASCNIRARRVLIAKELKTMPWPGWIEPLLYHEMCHAVLDSNVERCGTKRLWHGTAFSKLENRHPAAEQLRTWIKRGGWRRLVRIDRAQTAAAKRRGRKSGYE